MTMELKIKGHKIIKIITIGVYAPTDDADFIIKEELYSKLTIILPKINPRKEILC